MQSMLVSANHQVKMMKLQKKAVENLANPFEKPDDKTTSNSGVFDILERHNQDMQMNSVQYKLKAGKRLSLKEMQYLKQNNPDLYYKAYRAQIERDNYKKGLKKCRSKQEVRQMRMQKTQQLLTETKAIAKHGSAEGTEDAESIQARGAAIREEHKAFTQSATYKKLPERISGKKRRYKVKTKDTEPAVRSVDTAPRYRQNEAGAQSAKRSRAVSAYEKVLKNTQA